MSQSTTTDSLTGHSIFVTGGYGLLGGWLVQGLLDRGAEVTLLSRDKVTRSRLVTDGLEDRCNVVYGDLCDPGLVERAIGEHECDSVFHLAAQTIVGTANRSPISTFESNIRGTWLLLEAARAQKVSRVVVAASDKAYGSHTQLPYLETHELNAKYPYDVSKACTDLITRSYWHTYELPTAVTRFANLYGGGDLNKSRLIPETAAAVLENRSPIIRSDGSPERDFLFVDDAVDAYMAIWQALGEQPELASGEAFNAGSGQGTSVREIVETICKVAGSDVKPQILGKGIPSGEIDRQFVSGEKLKKLTGWQPQVNIEDGLQRTIQWYDQNRSSWQR